MRHCRLVVASLVVLIFLTTTASAAKIRPTGASVAGEVLVKVKNGADIHALEQLADADRSERIANVRAGALWRMHSRSRSTEALATALAKNPNVEYAEPNFILQLTATPNDPYYPQLWGLRNTGQNIGGAGTPGADISAEAAWNVTTGSAAIVVGVVDTGVDYNHPDLAANMWSNSGGKGNALCAAGTHGFNAITKTCDPMDDHDHGTHVAGTIGAVGNNGVGVTGVNWTTSIMALKFLGSSGSGTTAGAIAAIDFAIQAKIDGVNVRVLSNSWGGGGFSKALLDVINKANEHDILFVAAAGNDSSNNDIGPHYPSNYATPNMLSVAATNNRDELAYFSNYGPTTVHLGAPGQSILSSVPGSAYTYFSGTSMATPHVSGVAALVLAKTPSLTTTELKTLLLNSTDPISSLSGITVTGGRLNAATALGLPAPANFKIAVTPASRSVAPGGSVSYTVSITPLNGFAGTVNLSVTGLPPNSTASFNPPSTASTSTLTVNTSVDTSPYYYPYFLLVKGVGGALTRTTYASLQVTSAPVTVACPTLAQTNSYTMTTPAALARADFNRDGKADLAVARVDANRINILRNNGAG
ncbi:MAG: S8 family serine peptidase, partial [Thermoanaerobaculia bacterium]